MLLEISNKVCINIEEANSISKEIIKSIKEKLTFLNPEYITKEKMNIPIWGTPKHLKLYEEVNNKLMVPYGFLTFIKELFYPYKITRKDCSFELNDNEEVDYNSKIGLRDYQELVKNTVINAKANSGIIVMPAGSGKGHPLNTKLYTPTGLKEIGKLNIGDQVIGSNGKPTTVTGVYDRGVLDTYRVYFNDDSFLDCDEEHLFQTAVGILNVKELIEKLKTKIKIEIPRISNPIEFVDNNVTVEKDLLSNKDFIEDKYKYSSVETRRKIIELVSDIDLSYKGYSHEFLLDIEEIKETLNTKSKRFIMHITQIKSTEIRCISVDANDHLYVTENAIVTHNTQTSLEIIASLKKKTLWITHTQDLLKQSLDRARANFDLNKEAFGTITSGKINLGTHITFATVQTLAKIDLNEIKDKFDMLVVDETHRVVANVKKMGMFQKIIESIPCRYKYGLTATEHRSDDLFDCVYYLIGNKLIDIDKETIKENLVPVNIRTINTSYNIINNTNVIDSDGTLVYSKMLSDMSLCATRNISILNILHKEKNEFNLVLSNRLEHLNELADKLDSDCRYAVIDGNTKKKLREQAIEDARNGNINFLFATFALAKEGLDIPRLNRLHLTQPVKDYAVVVQSLGRIARTFVNKDFAIAYDYSDVNVGMLKKQYRERCKHYLRENYKVI